MSAVPSILGGNPDLAFFIWPIFHGRLPINLSFGSYLRWCIVGSMLNLISRNFLSTLRCRGVAFEGDVARLATGGLARERLCVSACLSSFLGPPCQAFSSSFFSAFGAVAFGLTTAAVAGLTLCANTQSTPLMHLPFV